MLHRMKNHLFGSFCPLWRCVHVDGLPLDLFFSLKLFQDVFKGPI
jgi:hypothetical protein